MKAYPEKALTKIRNIVSNKKVICALSGGVDSSFTAILIHKAIGEQLTCIYVDHGLMRKNESQEVIKLKMTAYFHKWTPLKMGGLLYYCHL